MSGALTHSRSRLFMMAFSAVVSGMIGVSQETEASRGINEFCFPQNEVDQMSLLLVALDSIEPEVFSKSDPLSVEKLPSYTIQISIPSRNQTFRLDGASRKLSVNNQVIADAIDPQAMVTVFESFRVIQISSPLNRRHLQLYQRIPALQRDRPIFRVRKDGQAAETGWVPTMNFVTVRNGRASVTVPELIERVKAPYVEFQVQNKVRSATPWVLKRGTDLNRLEMLGQQTIPCGEFVTGCDLDWVYRPEVTVKESLQTPSRKLSQDEAMRASGAGQYRQFLDGLVLQFQELHVQAGKQGGVIHNPQLLPPKAGK